jgi:hypothetical protein
MKSALEVGLKVQAHVVPHMPQPAQMGSHLPDCVGKGSRVRQRTGQLFAFEDQDAVHLGMAFDQVAGPVFHEKGDVSLRLGRSEGRECGECVGHISDGAQPDEEDSRPRGEGQLWIHGNGGMS